MVLEAADARRRDVLRSARAAARGAVRPSELLAFLDGATALLGGRAARPRPRKGAGTRFVL